MRLYQKINERHTLSKGRNLVPLSLLLIGHSRLNHSTWPKPMMEVVNAFLLIYSVLVLVSSLVDPCVNGDLKSWTRK